MFDVSFSFIGNATSIGYLSMVKIHELRLGSFSSPGATVRLLQCDSVVPAGSSLGNSLSVLWLRLYIHSTPRDWPSDKARDLEIWSFLRS